MIKRIILILELVLVLSGICVVSAASSIIGVVTGPDGVTPLQNIRVETRGPGWSWGPSTYSDANGQYTVGGLAAGAYRVSFQDDNGDYACEVYNNIPGIDLWNSGMDIMVPESATVSNINASLTLAAKISGVVTGPGGVTPLQNVNVQVYRWTGSYWSWQSYAYTDGSGYYEVGGLAGGVYRVSFRDDNGYYASEVYSNIPGDAYWNYGTGITVPESATVSNINASLAVAAKISGVVTGPGGVTPLQDVYVQIYYWTGSYWNGQSSTVTDGNGYYEVGGLVAGTYRVAFRDFNGNYAPEIYNNIPGNDAWNNGTGITVPESATVSNINASLAVAAKISGVVTGPGGVTPLKNIYVQLYRWTGDWWSWVWGDQTEALGQYEARGLVAGTYRVSFRDFSGNYVPEIYNNIPGDDVWNKGTGITVPESATVSSINASLDLYATLAGVVSSAGGAVPVAGIMVVMSGISNDFSYSAITREDGSYNINAVYPGIYAVRTRPSNTFLGQWYGHQLYVPDQNSMPPGGTAITLAGGGIRMGVNFALDNAVRITGRITGSGNGLQGSHVKAKNGTFDLKYEGDADSNGVFELSGLMPGSYTLKAEADFFADEWWPDTRHEALANAFSAASGDHLDRNFDLGTGQSPALVEVTSDPAGAVIYLDYQVTPNLTPAILDLGEASTLAHAASHVITVKKDGCTWPAPRTVPALEAETGAVHFDLTSSASGCIKVSTVPAGAQVYVDYADSIAGVTPVTFGNLAPGSHVVLLGRRGFLQPRPVLCSVNAGGTNLVVVPLVTNTSPARIIANVTSVPAGASVYVDYLPTTNVTGVIVDWMDPASHSGPGWRSASHVILLRKNGYKPAAPRHVTAQTNQAELMMIDLLPMPQCTLNVSMPAYGKGKPSNGVTSFDEGSSVVATITNSPVVVVGTSQYVCSSWLGTGSVPTSGSGTNSGHFTITNNSTLTWLWTTNYWLHATAVSNGFLNIANGWLSQGSNVQIVATANDYYHFAGWAGQTNSCAISSNTITVPMTQARNLTAYFEHDAAPTATLMVNGSTGGVASGGGSYTVGQVVLISATTNSGWHFTQWQDGNTGNPRWVTVPAGGASYTAYFAQNTSNLIITDPGAQQGFVGVMFTLPLDIVPSTNLTVTVSGLPLGLKYNAIRKVITGVPTTEVMNKIVTISARSKVDKVTQTFTMSVDPLPLWAWGTFNGWYRAGTADVGVASLTVTKQGKISGKCSAAGTNYTFSAASYTNGSSPSAGFRVAGNAQSGKTTVPVTLEVNHLVAAGGPASLSMVEGRASGVLAGKAPVVLYRNVWSDPDMKLVATNLDGYYTATLPGDGRFGSGYLAFTLRKGDVKSAGKLADGTKVSLSSSLLLDESNRCLTVLYSAPTTYKGGCFFGVTEFLRSEVGPPVIVHPLDSEAFVWENRDLSATDVYSEGFARDIGLVGGWYDKLGNLYAYYTNKTLSVGVNNDAPEILVGINRYGSVFWNPADQPLSLVTNVQGVLTGIRAQRVVGPVRNGLGWHYSSESNTVGLIFTLTRPTGLFKGSFKAWFDYGMTHTSRSIPFEGVLTPEREDPNDGIEGRGFYLWSDKGQYTNSPNKVLSYPFKWSCDFLLFSRQ